MIRLGSQIISVEDKAKRIFSARSLQLPRVDAMKRVWITTAEVKVEPGDMPLGDTLGFMRVTMWASSQEEFVQN